MRLRAAWLAAGLAAAPAAAAGFGFKGLELGSAIAQVAALPKYLCRGSRAPGADTICGLRPGEAETIAGAPVDSLYLFYGDGRLTSIALHLDERYFARVVAALAGKYGPPALKTETVHNRTGAAFENRIHTWSAAGASLEARRYAARLDQSAVRFTAHDLIRAIEARRAAVARDPSQDL